MNSCHTSIDSRRIGEYGHYVVPLTQLAEDLEEFIGVDFHQHLNEVRVVAREGQGVHPEEAAVLHLLVRVLQPKFVLETGTYKGYSTTEIARALQLNECGHLVTVDVASDTGSMVPPGLRRYVTFERGQHSRAYADVLRARGQTIDLFFHDSLHTFMNTIGELIWFADLYSLPAVIVCHDAKMDFSPDFGVGKAVRDFARAFALQYRVLDTTCGLAVLRWDTETSQSAIDEIRRQYVNLERDAHPRGFKRLLRRLAR